MQLAHYGERVRTGKGTTRRACAYHGHFSDSIEIEKPQVLMQPALLYCPAHLCGVCVLLATKRHNLLNNMLAQVNKVSTTKIRTRK